MDPNAPDVDEQLKERFKQLPKIVQDAILSADVEQHLRALADSHQLHLDQWDILETEVQMTLLGFQEVEDLQANIQAQVGVTPEIAASLAQDISKIVFEPIREALDRGLGSPQAKQEEISDVDKLRNQVLQEAGVRPGGDLPPQGDVVVPPTLAEQVTTPEQPSQAADAPQPVVTPGTPPAAPPDGKVERAPISESYHAQNPSTARKSVEGDPYREQLK